MGVRMPSVASTTILNSPIVTTAETVVVTSPPINLSLDFEQLMIFWWVSITCAASVTSVSSKLRRGTTTAGTQVNVVGTDRATASVGYTSGGSYVDTPGAVAGQQYSITCTMNGAGANSTVQDVSIIVIGL